MLPDLQLDEIARRFEEAVAKITSKMLREQEARQGRSAFLQNAFFALVGWCLSILVTPTNVLTIFHVRF